MRRRGAGAVVNFSSVAGSFGQSGRAIYPASKAAIRQLTRNQAMQWRIRHACRVERMSVHKASRVFEVDRKTVRKMLSGIVTLTAVWPVCGSRGQSLCDGRHLPPLSHRVTAELAKRPAENQVALDVEEIVGHL